MSVATMFEDDFDEYMNPARFRAELREAAQHVEDEEANALAMFVDIESWFSQDMFRELAEMAASVDDATASFMAAVAELQQEFPTHDEQLSVLSADVVAYDRAKKHM